MAFGTFVQQLGVFRGATTSPTTVAYSSNVTAGNLLIASIGIGYTSLPTLSVPTDTQGNTWILLGSSSTQVNLITGFWYAIAKTTGANTVSFNWTGTVNGSNELVVAEYSGPFGAVDGFQAVSGTGQTTSVSGPTTTNTDLVVILGNTAGATTFSPLLVGGYALRSPSSGVAYALGDLNGVAPGLQSGGVNWGASGTRNTVAIFAFTGAGSGGGTSGWVNRHRKFVNKR